MTRECTGLLLNIYWVLTLRSGHWGHSTEQSRGKPLSSRPLDTGDSGERGNDKIGKSIL